MSILKINDDHAVNNNNEYKIVYFIDSLGPISEVVRAYGVDEDEEYITFFDKYGEDECQFYKKDVITYYKV